MSGASAVALTRFARGGRQMLVSPDGQVVLGLDIAGLNHNAAWLSILLAVFVILELATCIMVLNHSAMTIIVTPVAKILGTIKENAQHVLKALDEDEVRGSSPTPTVKSCSCLLFFSSLSKLARIQPTCIQHGLKSDTTRIACLQRP